MFFSSREIKGNFISQSSRLKYQGKIESIKASLYEKTAKLESDYVYKIEYCTKNKYTKCMY